MRSTRAEIVMNEQFDAVDVAQRVLEPSERKSALYYSDSIQAKHPSSEVAEVGSSSGRRVLLVLVILLGIPIVAGGSIYWFFSRNAPVVLEISEVDKPAKPDPLGDRGALVPVSADMLHVTSIALGSPRLIIVNGKRLAQGDWLVVKTPNAEASVRIISIEDGVVRFKQGKQTIDARLQLNHAAPVPH